jgi:hypothetical protein
MNYKVNPQLVVVDIVELLDRPKNGVSKAIELKNR